MFDFISWDMAWKRFFVCLTSVISVGNKLVIIILSRVPGITYVLKILFSLCFFSGPHSPVLLYVCADSDHL